MKRAFDWLFRSRTTGRITIVQFPNIPLWAFIAGEAVTVLAHPHGAFRDVVTVWTRLALLAWALWEIVRGVNPWRRILGAVVLALTIASALR